MKSNNANSEQPTSYNDTNAAISGVKNMQQSAVGVVEQHKHGKQTITIDISEQNEGNHTTISCLENVFDSFVKKFKRINTINIICMGFQNYNETQQSTKICG